MSELVQNSREIKSTINGDLSWKRDDNGSIYFDCKFMPNWKIPRGIRCSGITLPKDAQLREFFEETCRALKSQRITCTRFFLDSNILNNDQWAILFNQLKPVNICVYSDLSNRYEVLLNAEQRRGNHLSLSLQFEDAIPALFNVLPRFQDVRFNVLAMKIEATSSSSLIEWILEFLSSQTLPDLRKFDVLLFSSEEGNIAPSNELRQQYARFNPVVLKQREMVDHTMKCVFLQNESFCIASLNFFCSKIEYRKGIEE